MKIESPLHDRLEQAVVDRVSTSKRKDVLRIYLFSTRLILKMDIRKTEEEIKKQLFPDAMLSVIIQERFELSSQYTPENLMKEYRDSILEELREYSHIEYTAFRTAEIAYSGADKMTLTVEDTVLNRSKETELVRVLEKIFVERCGLCCSIGIEYREAVTGKFAEDDALKIQMKVDEIAKRVIHAKSEQKAAQENGGQTEGSQAKPAATDTAGRQNKGGTTSAGGKQFGGKSFGGEFRKSRSEFRRGGD